MFSTFFNKNKFSVLKLGKSLTLLIFSKTEFINLSCSTNQKFLMFVSKAGLNWKGKSSFLCLLDRLESSRENKAEFATLNFGKDEILILELGQYFGINGFPAPSNPKWKQTERKKS